MNSTQQNIRLIKKAIGCLSKLYRENKISDCQLQYLLYCLCSKYVELQFQDLIDTQLESIFKSNLMQ